MKMTDRRTFLKRTAAAGALAAISDMDSLFAQEAGAPAASGIPDLVAVRNGTRAEMVRKAVETLGGMQAFVKPGPDRRHQAEHRLEQGSGIRRQHSS